MTQLTGTVKEIVGTDQPLDLQIEIRANQPVVPDPGADTNWLGHGVATVDGNVFTVDLPDGDVLTLWQIVATWFVPVPGRRSAKRSRGWSSAWFRLDGASTLADVVPVPASPVAEDTLAGLAEDVVEIREHRAAVEAVQTTNDGIVTGLLNDPDSDTSERLSATIGAATEPGGAVWEVGPTPINVRRYGISPTNTAAENDAALAALFADYLGAAFLAFPDTGTFQFSTPLPARNHLQIGGRGRQTILDWTAGNMLAVSGSTLLQSARFADLQIVNSGAATHLIDVTGTGGLTHTSFERCDIHPGIDGASIFKANANNLFGIFFRDCLLSRNAAATVPAFDIVGQSGAGTNNIHMEGGEWHSHECASSPFFKADTSSGSPLVNLTFEKIIGEQNHGGMIHLGGATVVRVNNVIDYDSSLYSDDLFKFTAGVGGGECNAVDIDQAGSYGSAGLAGGKVHLRIGGGVAHRIGWIPKNASQQGSMSIPQSGRIVRHFADDARPFRSVTVSETLTDADYGILGAGASITLSLPAVAAMPRGRGMVIKNVHSTSLTLDTADAATIDGAASVSLAQYEAVRLLTNGSNWYKV